MAISIEKEGKTVSEATISACEALGVARSEIEVEVLDEGSKGVFGIGSRNARVRATARVPHAKVRAQVKVVARLAARVRDKVKAKAKASSIPLRPGPNRA